MSSGYSTTPLAKKLGIKAGFKIKLINAPSYYFHLFTDMPADIQEVTDTSRNKHFIHFFTTDDLELQLLLPLLKQEIIPGGIIWISWPKKSAGVPTMVGENMIRDVAIKNGLVDIKVCAIDNIWSGLKLVIPVKDRVAHITPNS